MAKRLIVCSDGTWNTPDQKTDEGYCPTNVIKFARALKPSTNDGIPQIVFYDKGVGTGNWLDRFVGGATGKGLLKNVQDAYRFLVHNYEEETALLGRGNMGETGTEPGFEGEASGNLRLKGTSPCIDFGNNHLDYDPLTPGFQPLPLTDLAGKRRIVDGNEDGDPVVDMGAYEFQGGGK